MSERDRGILAEFAAMVRRRFPTARVWAFGSRVSGRATEESDLDVCIVVDGLDETMDREIMHMAWRVGFDNRLLISTVTYRRDEFEEGPCSESPLVKTVLHEGVPA